jgi:hypothetical protein
MTDKRGLFKTLWLEGSEQLRNNILYAIGVSFDPLKAYQQPAQSLQLIEEAPFEAIELAYTKMEVFIKNHLNPPLSDREVQLKVLKFMAQFTNPKITSSEMGELQAEIKELIDDLET